MKHLPKNKTSHGLSHGRIKRGLSRGEISRGQTSISLLTAIALFAILGHALFSLVAASFTLVSFTRARVAARHLAQEKMESIRNLPYTQVGTVGGIPAGSIEQSEKVQRNGLNYSIETGIVYIDDPFDGFAPDDLLPTDYKRVRVDVSWEGLASSKENPITLISDISPKGVETTEGGGTLSILVFDSNAQPVSQAGVSIIAADTDPQINLIQQTGENGRIILPGAPTCVSCYQITVTKDGYSSERTYSVYEVENPDKPHQSVIEGYLTEISFAIDMVSSITIRTLSDEDNGLTPIENVEFSVRGDKILGTDSQDRPVYKYDNTFTTNASGEYEIDTLEWDNYYLSVDANTSWDVSGTNPHTPFVVLPNTDNPVDMSLSAHSDHSLLVKFTSVGNLPIASVSARLYDDLDFEATASSGIEENPNFGQAFFSNLSDATYHLVATISGYLDHTSDIDVQEYTTESIILNE